MHMKITTVELAGMELAHCTRAAVARGILPSPDPDPGRAIQQYENYYENCYENFAADDPKCWTAAADNPKFPKLENHLYWLLFQVQLYRSTGGLTLKN